MKLKVNPIIICIVFLLLGMLLASYIFPSKCVEGNTAANFLASCPGKSNPNGNLDRLCRREFTNYTKPEEPLTQTTIDSECNALNNIKKKYSLDSLPNTNANNFYIEKCITTTTSAPTTTTAAPTTTTAAATTTTTAAPTTTTAAATTTNDPNVYELSYHINMKFEVSNGYIEAHFPNLDHPDSFSQLFDLSLDQIFVHDQTENVDNKGLTYSLSPRPNSTKFKNNDNDDDTFTIMRTYNLSINFNAHGYSSGELTSGIYGYNINDRNNFGDQSNLLNTVLEYILQKYCANDESENVILISIVPVARDFRDARTGPCPQSDDGATGGGGATTTTTAAATTTTAAATTTSAPTTTTAATITTSLRLE